MYNLTLSIVCQFYLILLIVYIISTHKTLAFNVYSLVLYITTRCKTARYFSTRHITTCYDIFWWHIITYHISNTPVLSLSYISCYHLANIIKYIQFIYIIYLFI